MDRNAPQCRQNSLVREQRAAAMRTLSLPSGTTIPVLGQDTWGLGRDQAKRKAEIAAFRLGLDLGMTLIDTTVVYKQRIYTLISTMLDNRPGPQYFPIRQKGRLFFILLSKQHHARSDPCAAWTGLGRVKRCGASSGPAWPLNLKVLLRRAKSGTEQATGSPLLGGSRDVRAAEPT